MNQLFRYMNTQPSACAQIVGSESYPEIAGWAYFYKVNDGILLVTEVNGLPNNSQICEPSFFGFHIHEGSECTGTEDEPFAKVGGHYSPHDCPHPEHAGDLPPLFGNEGYAFMAVYTSRITVQEIINRTIVIHANPDDFKTQPDGDAGEKIACGVIMQNGC